MLRNIEQKTYHYAPTARSGSEHRSRVAAYCRVSTLTEQQEDSFEVQCAYYHQKISADPNMELVGVYGDQGHSGLSTKNRTALASLLKDCDDGKVDIVMTRSVSRLSRNMTECVEIVAHLKSLGISVQFEKEHLSSMDANCELFFHVLAAMAQEESNSLSKHISWAYRERAKIGVPNRKCPYGYKKSGQEWQIDEDAARRVRLAFQLASQKIPLRDIIQKLNELEQSLRTKVCWRDGRVRFMLQNEAYRGDILTSKNYTVDYLTGKMKRNEGEVEQYYIEEHHVPIVSAEVFDAIQQYIAEGVLNVKKRRKKHE